VCRPENRYERFALTPEGATAGRPGLALCELALVVAMALFVGVPSLFTRGLWVPDEPRYMEVAREMVASGDYVLPRLNGEQYAEKPPLFFWLAALLWRAGLGYNAGRIVTVIAVLATLALLHLALRQQMGRNGAFLAAAVCLSTFLLLSFSKIGVLDALLTLFVTGSLLSGYYALRCPGRGRWFYWLACYGCAGLGALTKGPVALALPGLVLPVYALTKRGGVNAGGWVHLAGVGVLGAVVLPWLVPALARGGSQYAYAILVKQNIGRVVTSFSHRKPFYWYAIWAPVCFLPWALILPVAIAAAARGRERAGDAPWFAVIWMFVPLLFFSLVSGKRVNYIVPLVPAAGIMVGSCLTSEAGRRPRWVELERWLLRAALLLVILLIVGAMSGLVATAARARFLFSPSEGLSLYLERFARWLTWDRLAVGILMLALPLGVSIAGLIHSSRSSARGAVALAGAMLLLSLPLDLILTPPLDSVKSGKALAEAVQRHAQDGVRLYTFRNEFHGMYNLYTGIAPIPVIQTVRELREVLREPGALVIAEGDELEQSLMPGEAERYVCHRDRVDSRAMVLLCSGGQAEAGAP